MNEDKKYKVIKAVAEKRKEKKRACVVKQESLFPFCNKSLKIQIIIFLFRIFFKQQRQ
ncbi:hypothetical protein [Desemzia sp. FAM 23991]|uniref:hypothetical protein n=1 Tax=unclassified Desemzia TaxID=2685243 RepID=UPI0038851C71